MCYYEAKSHSVTEKQLSVYFPDALNMTVKRIDAAVYLQVIEKQNMGISETLPFHDTANLPYNKS